MDHFLASLKYGIRGLLRNPAFSIASILTLGLGIGANALVYSVTRAVFLKPLPYSHEESLVSISSTRQEKDGTTSDDNMTAIDAVLIPELTQSMESVGGSWPGAVAVTGEGDPETVQGA